MFARLHSFYAAHHFHRTLHLYNLPSYTVLAHLLKICVSTIYQFEYVYLLYCMVNVDAEAQTHSVAGRCMKNHSSLCRSKSVWVHRVQMLFFYLCFPLASSCTFGYFGRLIHTTRSVRARLLYLLLLLLLFFLSFYFTFRVAAIFRCERVYFTRTGTRPSN